REARDLPWRRRRTGYTALVSEAMLQQTQVARVVERYRAFVRRFPNVRRLAKAREQAVLAEWQGMGYYRRARNLHAAAKMIVGEFGGRVPRTADQLRTLPGVGRYTAASIASIVYGERTPLVDGNVQRVLARLDVKSGRAQDPQLVKWAWERTGQLVALAESPGSLNEGLMELGAVVCTPRNPTCETCPVARHCRARRQGRQNEIPSPQKAAARARVHHHALVVRRNGRVLLEQRPADGMWSRMWQVPTVEAGRPLSVHEIKRRLPTVSEFRRCAKCVHNTTHRHITFHVYTARSRQTKGVWRHVGDMDDLPMSNAQRKVLEVAGAVG
ncbi:MAG: A/G-specific adenine glycosylase, partial [Planctomycetota bacterium]